jgi:hypothetical protein
LGGELSSSGTPAGNRACLRCPSSTSQSEPVIRLGPPAPRREEELDSSDGSSSPTPGAMSQERTASPRSGTEKGYGAPVRYRRIKVVAEEMTAACGWCGCLRQEHEGRDGDGPCGHCDSCQQFEDESPTVEKFDQALRKWAPEEDYGRPADGLDG